MKLPIVVMDFAEKELVEAVDWYNEQQPGFGQVFEDRVWKTLDKIVEHPQLYALKFESARTLRVDKHPHQIVYTIESDRIVVWAIYHSSRNPDAWKRRFPYS